MVIRNIIHSSNQSLNRLKFNRATIIDNNNQRLDSITRILSSNPDINQTSHNPPNPILSQMFDEICSKIISPPKFKYSMYDLGSTLTKWGKRTDFQIINQKNHKMSCSLYQPHQVKHQRACVVYLHSMNGSRLEGSVYVQKVLKEGVSYCTFDFSGCGNSDGTKISFGANEKYDIEALINKLKQTFYLNKFILWGRSMGSVSAIKYSQLIHDKSNAILSYQKDEIVGLVLDSSFKSFSKLLIEIGHTQSEIPKFLIQAGFFMIKNTLQTNGEFKITELDLISESQTTCTGSQKWPLHKVSALNLPVLFLASKEDKTVPYEHSLDMFNAYKCRHKQLKFFKGLHNESRQDDYVLEVVTFINKVLKGEKPISSLNEQKLDTQQGVLQSSNKSTLLNDKSKHTKTSILKLLEEKTANESSDASYEFESIQSGCVCSMFDNDFVKPQTRQLYRDKVWTQRQRKDAAHNNVKKKGNFNCDQQLIDLKEQQNIPKMKKSITDFSLHSYPKTAQQFHGPNLPRTNTFNSSVQLIQSPRSFKQMDSRIDQNISLALRRLEERRGKPGDGGMEGKVTEELYKPLRVGSEGSLRVGLMEGGKGE